MTYVYPGEAKRRAVALITDRSRLEAIVCEREIDAAARRALAVTMTEVTDAGIDDLIAVKRAQLSYEPSGPCNDCGAPAEWRHALGCPEDREV